MFEEKQVETSGDYLKVIKRVALKRLWLIILLTVVAASFAYVGSKFAEPVYESTALIRIQEEARVISEDRQTSRGQKSIGREVGILITQREFVRGIMDKLGIGSTAKTQREYNKILEKLQKNIKAQADEGSDLVQITVRWNEAKVTMEIANALAADFIEKYGRENRERMKQITDYIEGQLNLVKVKLGDIQRDRANYEQKGDYQKLSRDTAMANAQLATLQSRDVQLEVDIQVGKMHLNRIKEQLKLPEEVLEEYDSSVTSAYLSDNSLIQFFKLRIVQLKTEMASLEETYTGQSAQLSQRKHELDGIEKKMNEEIIRIFGEKKEIRADDPMQQSLLARFIETQTRIESLEDEKVLVTKLISNYEAEMKKQPEGQAQYLELLRELRVNEELYTLLLKRLSEARIVENTDMLNMTVTEPAYEPYKKLRPKTATNTIFGAIMGLLLGISASMLIEYFDDSFRTIFDVEKFLKLPVLAAIPKFQKRIGFRKSGKHKRLAIFDRKSPELLGQILLKRKLLTAPQLKRALREKKENGKRLGEILVGLDYISREHLSTTLGDQLSSRACIDTKDLESPEVSEFYRLKTSIKFALFSDKPIKTLLITSAVAGEGKTMSVSYLVLILSKIMGLKTLLVDADLRHPSLHRLFGCKLSNGLSDLLINGASIDNYLHDTKFENLKILTCGTQPPNPAALLGSQKMKDMVEQMKNQFDIVLFDSSPVFPLADSVMLSGHVDGAILAVQAGATRRGIVKRAVREIQESNTKLLGIILNQTENELPKYMYNYSGSE